MPEKTVNYQIIFENESILIINKPSEVHSSLGEESNFTITNFLKIHYPKNFLINQEGGTLQRLDFETSGCLLIAKTIPAFNYFKKLISEHQLTKEYLFLTNKNLPNPKTVTGFIYSRYRGSKKVKVSAEERPRSLFAETKFSLEESISAENIYLIKATTNYGRRHQVRAQAGSIHIPLIGDQLYGSDLDFQQIGLASFPKFILHASTLLLPKNPFCNQLVHHAPVPNYLAEFLNNY